MSCSKTCTHHFRHMQAAGAWKKRFGKPNLQLFLIRHGRASGNHYHLFNGSKNDSPLTSLGRRQANKLAQSWPAKCRPDMIFCSTMRRARSTARPLGKRFGIKPHPRSDIIEQDFGDWSGKSALLMKEKQPTLFFCYSDGRLSHFVKSTPNGESWKMVIARARRFLAQLKKEHSNRTIAVVSHGVFLLACVHALTGIKPPKLLDMRFGNTSTAKITI